MHKAFATETVDSSSISRRIKTDYKICIYILPTLQPLKPPPYVTDYKICIYILPTLQPLKPPPYVTDRYRMLFAGNKLYRTILF